MAFVYFLDDHTQWLLLTSFWIMDRISDADGLIRVVINQCTSRKSTFIFFGGSASTFNSQTANLSDKSSRQSPALKKKIRGNGQGLCENQMVRVGRAGRHAKRLEVGNSRLGG
jgi:hypothetical protein